MKKNRGEITPPCCRQYIKVNNSLRFLRHKNDIYSYSENAGSADDPNVTDDERDDTPEHRQPKNDGTPGPTP